MSDISVIKDRIQKLMNLAQGEGAQDGEIDSALRLAASLIDKYHLVASDFEKKEDTHPDDAKMGMASGKTESPKFHKWETTLAWAITELFGCVKHYLDNHPVPFLVDGVAQFYTGKYAGQRKMCRKMQFYGPVLEAQEAAELFQEWCKSIATMGVMRWGGAYKSHGAMYCEGFATALLIKAREINKKRALVSAKPVALLSDASKRGTAETALAQSGSSAITLSSRYEILQERATAWLEEEQGVKLSNGSGRAGSKKGATSAFSEGHSHGSQAEFGRRVQRKQLPG